MLINFLSEELPRTCKSYFDYLILPNYYHAIVKRSINTSFIEQDWLSYKIKVVS